jgi:hypothetical protein
MAKQKNVPKKLTSEPVTWPFQRQIKVLDEGGDQATLSMHSWIIYLDAYTGKKFSVLVSKKSAFVENAVQWLTQMTKRGAHVEVLRMDPSGEYKAFVEKVKQVDCAHLQPINCKLTPRDSPQFNSLAEMAFPYLVACARAIMGGANIIPVKCQKQISIEAPENHYNA